MSITWNELQEQVVDMGFEEDSITDETEYGRNVRNAINRSISTIRSTVMPLILSYLKNEEQWGYEEENENGIKKWVFPKAKRLPSSLDGYDGDLEELLGKKIAFPEVLEPLLPLLVAHYVWLDDDLTKATIYWNEYDDLKNQIVQACNSPKNCIIVGGF